MTIFYYIISILALLVWLLITLINAYVARRMYVSGYGYDPKGLSIAPNVGSICGLVGFLFLPILPLPWRILTLVLAFIPDLIPFIPRELVRRKKKQP
jgi:hypothetical protein